MRLSWDTEGRDQSHIAARILGATLPTAGATIRVILCLLKAIAMKSEDTCLPVSVWKLQCLGTSLCLSFCSLRYGCGMGLFASLVDGGLLEGSGYNFQEGEEGREGEREPMLGMGTFTLQIVNISSEARHP